MCLTLSDITGIITLADIATDLDLYLKESSLQVIPSVLFHDLSLIHLVISISNLDLGCFTTKAGFITLAILNLKRISESFESLLESSITLLARYLKPM
jgi:hypothetical protein